MKKVINVNQTVDSGPHVLQRTLCACFCMLSIAACLWIRFVARSLAYAGSCLTLVLVLVLALLLLLLLCVLLLVAVLCNVFLQCFLVLPLEPCIRSQARCALASGSAYSLLQHKPAEACVFSVSCVHQTSVVPHLMPPGPRLAPHQSRQPRLQSLASRRAGWGPAQARTQSSC